MRYCFESTFLRTLLPTLTAIKYTLYCLLKWKLSNSSYFFPVASFRSPTVTFRQPTMLNVRKALLFYILMELLFGSFDKDSPGLVLYNKTSLEPIEWCFGIEAYPYVVF